jgi:uncharacterized protein (DUF2225 family)
MKVYAVMAYTTDTDDEYAIVYTSLESIYKTKEEAEKQLKRIKDNEGCEGEVLEKDLQGGTNELT